MNLIISDAQLTDVIKELLSIQSDATVNGDMKGNKYKQQVRLLQKLQLPHDKFSYILGQ